MIGNFCPLHLPYPIFCPIYEIHWHFTSFSIKFLSAITISGHLTKEVKWMWLSKNNLHIPYHVTCWVLAKILDQIFQNTYRLIMGYIPLLLLLHTYRATHKKKESGKGRHLFFLSDGITTYLIDLTRWSFWRKILKKIRLRFQDSFPLEDPKYE